MMAKIPWYESRGMQANVVHIISALALVFGAGTGAFDINLAVAGVFAAIQGGASLWAAINRLRKPTPPITDLAAKRTLEFNQRRG